MKERDSDFMAHGVAESMCVQRLVELECIQFDT
jgi:hypothetical protein